MAIMKIIDTSIDGLKILELNSFKDNRGTFQKIYNYDFFKESNLNMNIKESYYSISKKNIIRGMHFQIPPHDHEKIVYVTSGSILDVVLDIRKGSTTYGKYYQINLSAENNKAIIIPKGLAHGFKSLEDNTVVTYLQSSVYSPESDKGISYNSFGFNWDDENLIISEKDSSLPDFKDYNSPFIFGQD